jgi:hypothetical protein
MSEWLDDTIDALDHDRRLRTDLGYFAADRWWIQSKSGRCLMNLNPAQQIIHAAAEEQIRQHGMVRLLVLKSRQVGASEYTALRFSRNVLRNPDAKGLLVSYNQASATTLLAKCKFGIRNLPPEDQPPIDVDNAESLGLRSGAGISIAVAGTDGDVGRSQTARYVFCSEIGFWGNAQHQFSALMATLPSLPGTEAIVESTADAFGSFYHNLYQRTAAGENGIWRCVFIPWTIELTNRTTPWEGFALDAEERALAEEHKLSIEQMAWRRATIAQLNGDVRLFRKEHPMTATECWLSAGDGNNFIDAGLVQDAMRRTAKDVPEGKHLTIGLDVAGMGKDSTVGVFRYGRAVTRIERRKKMRNSEIAEMVSGWIEKDRPKLVVVDESGIGADVAQRLQARHGDGLVRGLNAGAKATRLNGEGDPIFAQMRAQLWDTTLKWLEKTVRLPNDPGLFGDLTAPRWSRNTRGLLQIEPKKDMAARGLPSPDAADALALSLAFGDDASAMGGGSDPRFNRTIHYPRHVIG